MDEYWVNNRTDTNPNNDHEVHKAGCRHLPLNNGIYLGEHPNCDSALKRAQDLHDDVDGCVNCIPECHNE